MVPGPTSFPPSTTHEDCNMRYSGNWLRWWLVAVLVAAFGLPCASGFRRWRDAHSTSVPPRARPLPTAPVPGSGVEGARSGQRRGPEAGRHRPLSSGRRLAGPVATQERQDRHAGDLWCVRDGPATALAGLRPPQSSGDWNEEGNHIWATAEASGHRAAAPERLRVASLVGLHRRRGQSPQHECPGAVSGSFAFGHARL